MKMTTDAKSWLDRYERTLGRHLPLKGRKDIRREFHSHLMDDLEEKFSGKTLDETAMKEYLQDLGSPLKKAAAHREDAYLISPAAYPLFRMVTGIVLLVLALVLLITQTIEMAAGEITVPAVLKLLAETLSALIQTLGVLVIVFFVLQKFFPAGQWEDPLDDELWTVENLPAREYPSRIKLADPVAGLVFSLLAILIFTVFSSQLGIHQFTGKNHIFTPVLSPVFWSLVPLLLFRWSLEIGFSILLIIQRRWSLALRLGDLALNAFTLGILVVFLRQGFSSLVLEGSLTGLGLEGLVSVLRILIPLLLGLGVLATVAEIFKKALALYREPENQEE